MTPTEILARCSAAGIRLQPAGDGLTIDAPSGALTPALVADLRTHKAKLLAMLQPATAAPGADHGNGPEGIDARAIWRAALDRLAGEIPGDVLAGCLAADARWESGPDLDADGWPVGTIEPSDRCSRCGGIEVWIDLRGGRHCQRCDTRGPLRTRRWLDGLARARKQNRPPRAAPGCELSPPADSQHLDSRRPRERPPGAFRGCEVR